MFNKEFIKSMLMRALHTLAQTAGAMITVGAAFSEVDWLRILSVSLVAAILSILKSIVAGTPESTTDGTMTISDAGDSTAYEVAFNIADTEVLQSGSILNLKVENNLNK